MSQAEQPKRKPLVGWRLKPSAEEIEQKALEKEPRGSVLDNGILVWIPRTSISENSSITRQP